MSTTQVLIVGAGPAGLVAALSLVKHGISVRIIDKAKEFHVGSRGFGIQPRTFELFQSLGFANDVLKLSTPIPTMRAYNLPGGTQVAKTWDLYEKIVNPWPDRPYANGACLSQETLEKVIREHLSKWNIHVELGKELVAIVQDAKSVTATIVNHQDTTQEIVTIEYLVGADGARGSSRKLLGLSFQGETRDTDGMVWGDVEIRGLTNDFWHIWGKPGHFTIMARPLTPSGDSSVFGLGITGQNFDPTELAEPEKVKEFVARETGRTDLVLGDFTWLSYFRPNMRMVNKFDEGRAFVVGDAAHVHSPTGGQGLNCSVQDSLNLAWKLALVITSKAPVTLLSTYNTERLPVITQMLHATTQLYTHTVAKEKPMDVSAAKPEDDKKSGWFRWRNNALHLYGVNYRYSSIVLEDRDTQPQDDEDMRAHAYQGYEGIPSLRAGDRAPEVPNLLTSDDEKTTLFSLLKPTLHTIVIFAAPGKEASVKSIVAASQLYSTGLVQSIVIRSPDDPASDLWVPYIVDRDGGAREIYLVRDGEVDAVIIRPDTFIGAIVTSADGVGKYFARILYPV